MTQSADRGAFEACAYCGERLAGSEWYPATALADGGSVSVRSFCDDGCLSAWRDSE